MRESHFHKISLHRCSAKNNCENTKSISDSDCNTGVKDDFKGKISFQWFFENNKMNRKKESSPKKEIKL